MSLQVQLDDPYFAALLAAGFAGVWPVQPSMAQTKVDFILNWVPGGDHAPYYYAKKRKAGMPKRASTLQLEPGKGSALCDAGV